MSEDDFGQPFNGDEMTENTVTSEQIQKVRNGLQQLSGTTQTGALLRPLIEKISPGLDVRQAVGMPVGPGALKSFLSMYFSDLVREVDRKGTDIVYRIGAASMESTVSDQSEGSNLREVELYWPSFASANPVRRLVFDRETKTLSLQSAGQQLSNKKIEINPVTNVEFRRIAEEFVAELNPEFRQPLSQQLVDGKYYYAGWLESLRNLDKSLDGKWGLFRLNAILELFVRRLTDAGVDAVDASAAQTILAQSQQSRRTKRQSEKLNVAPISVERSENAINRPSKTSEINVRDAASALIQTMPMDELRQIKFSLGVIFDAFEISKKK